jgi:two-component system, OmpR family, sensor histidine kinase CssS
LKQGMRRKLLLPLLCVSIGALAVCMAVISLVVTLWLEDAARQDLIYTSQLLMNQQSKQNEQNLPPNLALESAVKRQIRNLAEQQLVYLDASYDLTTPDDLTVPGLPGEDIGPQLRAAAANKQLKNVVYLQSGGQRWMASVIKASSPLNPDIAYTAVLYPLKWVDDFTLNLNLIILGVFFVLTAGVVITAVLTTTRIIRPLKKLGAWAGEITRARYTRHKEDIRIRELDELKTNLNTMAERLEKADEAQQKLLQNISHEIRTPLMSIQGYAEAIQLGVADDIPGATAVIADEAKRLSAMVSDIIYLSRLETAGDFFSFEKTILSQVVAAAAEKTRGAAIGTGKEISVIFDEDGIAIQADGEKLMRAVMNMMTNCIRHAKKHIWARLFTDPSGNACIEVSDDGEGFSGEDLKSLFTRFYKGKDGDHGLGMSIAKSIVEGHGGRITALNKPEGGAMFRIVLPIENPKPPGGPL